MTTGAGARKFIDVTNSVTIDSYSVTHGPVDASIPSLTGPLIDGLAPFTFQFNISGTGGNNLFDSDALPLEPPSLGPVNTTDHVSAILRPWNSPRLSIVTSSDAY